MRRKPSDEAGQLHKRIDKLAAKVEEINKTVLLLLEKIDLDEEFDPERGDK